MGAFGVAVHEWSYMTAHEILLIFLPALIFESAFGSDSHIMSVEFGQILIMAGPIVLMATGLSGVCTYYVLGYNTEQFPFSAALLLGSILSATDPVAVVALLKELGASKRLATMIEGESLMNDGTAMVIFLVILDIVAGEPTSAGQIIARFCRLSFGGPLLGLACGVIV